MKKTLILLSTILLISCGSRKTQQTKTDLKTRKVVSDNSTIETKTDTNTKVIDCTFTDEVEIIPIDNTKEIIVNGKVFKNVVLKHRKVKNNITTDKVEKVAKIEQKAVKTNVKAKRVVEVKQVDKPQFNYGAFVLSFWWLWLLIIAMVYIGWKNKKTLFM